MVQIENDHLRIQVSEKGAELQSIYSKETGLEYLWNGDIAFWGKRSPVLFPIVGGLKNNAYQYEGKTYELARHGFAREKNFTVTSNETGSISFTLQSDAALKEQYPFLFKFIITYSLHQHTLNCRYEVFNIDIKPIYFSIGAHPAFKIPLVAGTSFEDYYLLFNEQETASKWPLSAEGLIEKTPINFFNNSNRINLSKALFYGDALVFKGLKSTSIAVLTEKSPHGFKLAYSDFPYMGIWSAKDADFVCIEPWCGIADSVDATGNILQKEGIEMLYSGENFSRSWRVELK